MSKTIDKTFSNTCRDAAGAACHLALSLSGSPSLILERGKVLADIARALVALHPVAARALSNALVASLEK